MTDQRYDTPVLEPGEDAALARDLRLLARPGADDVRFQHDLRARLLQKAEVIAAQTPQRTPEMGPATAPRRATPRRLPGLRARLISIAAAIALVLGGLAGYLHLQMPTPVSAQQILHRALTMPPIATPDQAIHQTSTVYWGSAFGTGQQTWSSQPMTLTVDQWTQLDATGAISQQVTSGTSMTGTLVFRVLQTGRVAHIYGTLQNAIETGTMPKSVSYSWQDNPLDVADLRQLVVTAQQQSVHDLHLLPQRSLGGVTVDVVQVTASPDMTTTMYIDAQTYVIRGLDQTMADPPGSPKLEFSTRVTRFEVVPLSSVPAHTFELDAPASAHVLPPSSEYVDVAQAMRDGPAILLSGDADGLRLQAIQLYHKPYSQLSYQYQAGSQGLGSLDARTFDVSIIPAGSAVPTGGAPGGTTPHQLDLTIAGQPVHATYYEPGATGKVQQQLVFKVGTATVTVLGDGLRKEQFFAAVGALVDGHTHPDVATHLQRELDGN